MSGAVVQFPSQKVSLRQQYEAAAAAHRTRGWGVCVHCLGWRPEVTDFSCYGIGKWCDGCQPVLIDTLKRVLRGEALT